MELIQTLIFLVLLAVIVWLITRWAKRMEPQQKLILGVVLVVIGLVMVGVGWNGYNGATGLGGALQYGCISDGDRGCTSMEYARNAYAGAASFGGLVIIAGLTMIATRSSLRLATKDIGEGVAISDVGQRRFCSHCGASMQIDSTFCSKCGARINR